MNINSKYGYRYLGEGVKVSNDTRVTFLNNNDLIVGNSGSSKTGSVVYPQLKSLKDSSLIVADTKGQLAKMSKDELEAKGYDVKTLDFVNPENSCRYNPLDYIRQDFDGEYKEQDIAKLAACLVPLNVAKNDSFWPTSARIIIEFAISFTLMALKDDQHNMATVSKVATAVCSESADKDNFEGWIHMHTSTLPAKRYMQIQGMKAADKTFSCIQAFVTNALRIFDYKEYQRIFDPYYDRSNPFKPAMQDVNIASLGKKPSVLFLNISDTDHSMDDVVNLFYAQALQTLVAEADASPHGRLAMPVRIIMDDFASSALIPDFDKIISVVRSRDIWLTLCIQSLTQLESLYSHEQAITIMNNCDHIVYLGGNDLDSANFIGTRAMRTPESVLTMDRTKEYILESGKPIALVNKIPSYSFVDEDEDDCEMTLEELPNEPCA